MTRDVKHVQVLLSSPGDVSEERNAMEGIVQDLNVTWSRTLGISLELIRWETHTFPGFGIDPQDVINRQLPDDYDVFLGIMWTRFGTPTGRAGSGTEEEFLRAYERFKVGTPPLHLMVYFKDQPIAPSSIDPVQFGKVQAFKAEMSPRGGLYASFHTLEEFHSLVRIHLGRVVQEFVTPQGAGPQLTPSAASVAPATEAKDMQRSPADALDGDEEPGLLDLLETMEQQLATLNESSTRMGESQESLSERFVSGREEVERLNSTQPTNLAAIKRSIAKTAEAMENYALRMNAEIPIFSDAIQAALFALGQAGTVTAASWPEEKERLRTMLHTVGGFRASIGGTKAAAQGLRDTIASTPRMTTQLNKARRRTVSVLTELLEEYASAERLALQVEDLLKGLLGEESA